MSEGAIRIRYRRLCAGRAGRSSASRTFVQETSSRKRLMMTLASKVSSHHPMRFLIAGLACLAVGIASTEYSRRHPAQDESNPSSPEAPTTKKKTYPKAVATLLETEPAGTDTPTASPELAALLSSPRGDAKSGFTAVAEGTFTARELRGGFGAAVFVIDAQGHSGLVRASPGEGPKLILSRKESIGALAVDGSTVFFSEGGLIASTHARGGEDVTVRARFKNAVVTSLATASDVVVATLMPKGGDPLSSDSVGAVVAISSDGEVTLIAQEQVRPRGAQTDGKGAFWIAGFPSSLWRGALDGAFTSQLADTAEEPIALDGDGVYFRAPLGSGAELRRVGRAGGKLQTTASADLNFLVVSSGLIRFTTAGANPKLMEVTPGAEPSEVMSLPASSRGLALGGTSLFLLVTQDQGTSTLFVK